MTLGPLLFAAVLNLALGSTYFATRMALDGLPPFTIVLLRTSVAFALLAPFAGRGALRALLSREGGSRRALLTMGVAGFALPLALGNLGVARSSATNGALLVGVEPLCIALLAALVLGEPLTRLRGIALFFGVCGATTIVAGGVPFVTVTYAPHLVGDLLLVAHGAAWSLYTIAGKPLLGRHPPIAVTSAAALVGIPFLAPFAAAELPAVTWGAAAWTGLAWTLGLGVFASGLGGLAWNLALRRMDASQLAGFVFLQPLAGVALGGLVLGEPVTRWSLAGGALVFAGVYALVWEERARRAPAPRG